MGDGVSPLKEQAIPSKALGDSKGLQRENEKGTVLNLCRRRRYLYRGVPFGQLDALAVLGGFGEDGHLGQDAEHQEQAHCGEDTAIDDAHRREQEAAHYQHDADGKVDVEGGHRR